MICGARDTGWKMENTAGNERILQILRDTGLAQEQQNHIMECFRCGQWESGSKVLLKYRSCLLSEVHAGQDKLYCLDFLLRKIKQIK